MYEYFLQSTTKTKLLEELAAHGFEFVNPEQGDLIQLPDRAAIYLKKPPTGVDDSDPENPITIYSAKWCANVVSAAPLEFSDKVTTKVPDQPFNRFFL